MSRYLVACDAGGTMTDVIIVDEEGRSVIGKAPTSPHDESVGYMESFWEALDYMGIPEAEGKEFGKQIETAIYTGTSMLNTVINMSGYKTGILVTKGFEDIISQGRGSQTFIGSQWSEITHMQYRKHRIPLVPSALARGVTERIDMFGTPVIPMYEHEVREGARQLLVDEEVEAIAIIFLQSYVNPAHEDRAAEICREVMKEVDREVVLELSSKVAPTMREISRANATVVQAYASDPARKQLYRIEEELKKIGYAHSLKTVLGYGGITNIRYPRLFEAAMSGPVGGLMGAQYLSSVIGEENIVCSDVGGTSFDAGTITAGVLPIDREPGFQDMYVNVPMLGITSIGAGTGTYIRVDPQTNRIKLGPDSAGGTPGPTFMEAGNTTPTINDVNLLLGILSESNYLGGKVKINKDVSLKLFKEKVADPLGMDVYVAAETCLELLNVMMREHLVQSLMVGHDLREYVLLGYGGGGPLHLLGYAGDYPWKAVCTVPHAGGFSAWGGACMDYSHRRHKSVGAVITPDLDDATKLAYMQPVKQTWDALEAELRNELEVEGFAQDQISISRVVYMKYYGQLDDVEVESPVATLDSAADLDALFTTFEDLYTKMFTLAAKADVPSYHITEVCVVAKVATVKPKLRKFELSSKQPVAKAKKGVRPVFMRGEWQDADIWEMESLVPGNEIEGLAVIEASNTTLFVPPEWHVKIDEHDIYWITPEGRVMAELSLIDQLKANDEAFEQTGSLFGLETLNHKETDPGTYEAVWHILSNLCNAAWATGCKVSSSPIAAEGGDALWGLHTATGEAICISRGISAHAGLLSEMIKNFIRAGYEVDPGFKPGDIFENNDPHYGGIHSPDFDMCMPLFHDGKLIAWASCVSHVSDAGSVTPGSIGFLNPDCYSDGIPISMERVGENDRFYPWYEKRIRSRTRTPDFVMGDARGRLAGCLTIRERLDDVIEKYGLDFVLEAGQEYVEDSRRYAVGRVKTQTVPGRIRKSQFKDLAMKGKRVLLAKQDIDCCFSLPMELTINADASVSLSLRGASGTVPFGENISPEALKSGLMMGYSHIVGFDMFNSGPTSAWDVEMPPAGSWANPFPLNYEAASGVAWAPAVTWVSSLYEVFGRLFQMRGFIEEMAAGSATIMTAEFSGVNQTGMYLTGLTLEQASNGSPARGYSDGENSAWCIYTPEADFGNAEISELYYPILFLGRNVEPNSGGFGQFRGGLGHTAVWMVYNTPGLEYQCGDAGMRSKIVANHGMYGAYPVVPDRPAYAHDTNVKALIDAQKPLVHGRGDPEAPEIANRIEARDLNTDAIAPFVTPEPLTDYDIIVHPIGGAQAMGDPLLRDPNAVANDLNEGWTTTRVASEIHGVVTTKPNGHYDVDTAATEKKRADMREARKKRAIPFKEWWAAERKKVEAQENMDPAVIRMWATSMELSPEYGDELRAFWNLPADFVFEEK